jgi:hypothetical protein
MNSLKSLFFIISIIFAQNSYAQTWAKFTCFLLPQNATEVNQDESLILEIGQPEDGWPLEVLSINSKDIDIVSQVKQFQFELDPSTYMINSHLVWVTKANPELNSRNAQYNRLLSVAKIETVKKTTDGIESRDYMVSKLTTNVDAENPNATKQRTTYKCLEPELL